MAEQQQMENTALEYAAQSQLQQQQSVTPSPTGTPDLTSPPLTATTISAASVSTADTAVVAASSMQAPFHRDVPSLLHGTVQQVGRLQSELTV